MSERAHGVSRRHVNYSNVMSTLAMFLVIAGGTAWALENNSVKSRHIVNGQVKGKDTKKSQVQARVDGSCAPGLSIRSVAQNGTVTCETVGGGGSPTGPAGGDLAGSSYPNPVIASGAVNSAKVANESLTGADVLGIGGADVSDNTLTGNDVDESTLGQVPAATLGGIGRDTALQDTCNPAGDGFATCATVELTVPPGPGARVLMIGRVHAFSEDNNPASGFCRLDDPSPGTRQIIFVDVPGTDGEQLMLAGVTPTLGLGVQSFGLSCNQFSGSIDYNGAALQAVALSPS